MTVPSGTDDSDGGRAAGATTEPEGPIDYSGHRRKKGRYSTGALFRPREKRDRQRQGGRWEAEPRPAWGGLDEESEASRSERARADAAGTEPSPPDRDAGNRPSDDGERAGQRGGENGGHGENGREDVLEDVREEE